MIDLHIEVPQFDAKRALNKSLDQSSKDIKKDLQKHWDRGEDPEGNRWKDRKNEVEYKHPKLNKTGTMFKTAEFRFKDGEIVASVEEYGRFHQFGTKHMTDRRWLGVNTNSLTDISENFLKNLAEG